MNVTFSEDEKSLFVDTGMGYFTEWSLNIDDLIKKGCFWLKDYLASHHNEAEDVRQICQNYTHKFKK
ncbi:hypothetical protein [Nostoc sp. TCL240-02]|uniref:hypothetical protein n=1 Tax=Nostoc sp. TCL240-02 TaxID=2572090 RepID=UPI00157F8869|nr:hypothetical protein [Nostoc sp. TCL240-02]QKQ73132.1 hypothetical protein FBB35_06815 [Nostoc sp. TCL240-02]